MLYYVAKRYNVCIKLSKEDDKYKLNSIFPMGYTVFEANNIEEYFQGILNSFKCKVMNQKFYLYEVVDFSDNIVFSFMGTKLECEELKKYFDIGSVVKTKISGKSCKLVQDIGIATISTLKKRISQYPTFLSDFILLKEVNKDSQSVIIDAKYRDKETKELISNIDRESTYLNDNLYQKLFKSVVDLEKNYNALLSQQEGLRRVVKCCDYEIMNIVHDLEFGFDKVSACDGYMISKKVNEIRECRRRAKDKLEVIYTIMEAFSSDTFKAISEIPNRLENRKYCKRNSQGIFDDIDEDKLSEIE